VLATAAEGSLRDALSLLDQAATLAGGTVDEARCAEILALVDSELLEGMYSAVVGGDRAAAIANLSRLTEGGADPRQVLKEFVAFLRRLLLSAVGASSDVPAEERERMAALARAMPYENLLRAVSLTLAAEEQVRRVDDPGLVVQMLVLKLAELPRLRDLEATLSRVPASPPAREAAAPPRLREAGPRIVSLVPVESEIEEPSTGSLPERSQEPLERFHEILDSRRRVTAAQVSLAESIHVDGEDLVFRFGIDRAAAKEALEDLAAKKLLAEVAREAFGKPLRIVLKTGPPADGDLGKAAREVPRSTIARERASSRAESDPMVRSAMELFHGELTEIKEEE
jgi:DNA polymerase III gamma/tau subunit